MRARSGGSVAGGCPVADIKSGLSESGITKLCAMETYDFFFKVGHIVRNRRYIFAEKGRIFSDHLELSTTIC